MQARIHRLRPPDDIRNEARSWIEWGNPDAALRQRLRAEASGPARLLHLDYHPMNVLVAGRDETAVLDWTNARAGDPRADLARTVSILRFGPLCDVLPAPLEPVVRRSLEAGWRRGYREIAGRVRGMAPFYAWAGTVTLHDLSPRLGRTDLPWLTPAYLDAVRGWAAGWRECARLPE
jgi:aminoglycoside phosphotransferase (APT) family kinase protein